jgi:hypothetical protein
LFCFVLFWALPIREQISFIVAISLWASLLGRRTWATGFSSQGRLKVMTRGPLYGVDFLYSYNVTTDNIAVKTLQSLSTNAATEFVLQTKNVNQIDSNSQQGGGGGGGDTENTKSNKPMVVMGENALTYGIYTRFVNYYGTPDFAHKIIMSAFHGNHTAFLQSNNNNHHKSSPKRNVDFANATLKQRIGKGVSHSSGSKG